MKLRFAAAARTDFNRLIDDLIAVDPDRAAKANRGLRNAFKAVAAAPLRSPSFGRRLPPLRKKTSKPYLILYQVRGSEVLILRIVHQRSDWTSLV